jgi:hypothetical protein
MPSQTANIFVDRLPSQTRMKADAAAAAWLF